jgi:17beta-estradiol 17-dehydrogenase / very-long-chain 3-oxoacyl-CoA reductase
VNIASAAGMITNPLLAQYSAAKGYVEKFSRGLNAELAPRITVQCQVSHGRDICVTLYMTHRLPGE